MLYFNIPRTEKYSIAMCYFLGGQILCFLWLWKELEVKLLTPGQLLGCHWKSLATGGIHRKKEWVVWFDWTDHDWISDFKCVSLCSNFSHEFTFSHTQKRSSKDTLRKKVCTDCTVSIWPEPNSFQINRIWIELWWFVILSLTLISHIHQAME